MSYTLSTNALTVSQTASFLGISKNTVRRWETSGKIRVERTEGGHRRVDFKEIQRLLFEKRVKSQARNGYGRKKASLIYKAKKIENKYISVVQKQKLSLGNYVNLYKKSITKAPPHTTSPPWANQRTRGSPFSEPRGSPISKFNATRKWLRHNRQKGLIISLTLLFILSSIAAYFYINPKQSEAGWWNDNWQYRKKFIVSNSGGELSDQLISVSLGALSSGQIRSDCGDIRVTELNGSELTTNTYWVDCTVSTSPTVWIELSMVSSGDTAYYAYYGNPSATLTSDGTNLFPIFFEDFAGTVIDGSKFSYGGGGTFTQNEYLSMANNADSWDQYFFANDDMTRSSSYVLYGKAQATTGARSMIAWHDGGSGTSVNNLLYAIHLDDSNNLYVFEDGTNRGIKGTYTHNAWYDFKIELKATGATYYKKAITDNTWTQIYNSSYSSESSMKPGFMQYDAGQYSYTDNWLVTTYAATDPTVTLGAQETGPGPVAYWKFDEGADNTCPGGEDACDSTANANDGTFSSAPVWQPGNMCLIGKCLFFDGIDDAVNIPDPSSDSLDFGTSDFSIDTWVKLIDGAIRPGEWNFIVDKRSDGTTGYGFAIDASDATNPGRLILRLNDTTYASEGAAIQENVWTHVSVVRDSSTPEARFYINGQLDDTVSIVSKNISSSGNLAIGNRAFTQPANEMNGFIDEVKIYPYARSESEIKEDYNRGAQVLGIQDDSWLSNGLVAYWKMDENSPGNGCSGGEDSCDSSGNGNHGTWANQATSAAGKYGNGVTFDGTEDYVSHPTLLDTMPSSLTLSGWFKPDAAQSADMSGLGKVNIASQDRMYLFFLMSGATPTTIRFDSEENNNGTTTLDSEVTWVDDTWHHVVVTWDTTSGQKIYVNGDLKNSDSTATTLPNNGTAQDFVIGHTQAGSSAEFNGEIDEMRVYNRALTTSEVSKLYQWAPGPVAHWKMDEGSWNNDCSTDTVFDSSGNGNDGDACPNSTGPTGGAIGKYGNAGEFDGSGDYVKIADSSDLEPEYITVSAWIKTTKTGVVQRFFNKDDLSNCNTGGKQRSYSLYIPTDNIPAFAVFDHCNGGGTDQGDEWDYVQATTVVTDGLWHYIAGSWDGTTIKIYIDGVLEDTTNFSGSINQTTEELYFGKSGHSSVFNYFTGQIDDARIYNYARTPQQIVQDMNAGHPAPGSPVGSALGHWKFDEGYGDTANDSGTGGNNGDLAGSCPGAATCPTWTNSGKFGKALSFDNNNDYVDYGTSLNSILQEKSWTTSYWFNGGTGSEEDFLFANRHSSNTDEVRQSLTTAGKLLTSYDDDTVGDVSVIGSTDLVDSNWHFVVTTIDSNTLSLYVDGVLDNTGDVSGSGALVLDDQTILGARFLSGAPYTPGNAVYYNGLIDDVRVYNSTLTASQVKVLYNQGSASFGVLGDSEASDLTDGAGNPPVAHWNMDENTGTGSSAVKDTSGNNRHGDMDTSMTESDWVPGKLGSALDFDGSDDYVKLPNNNPIWLPTSDITVSALIYKTSDVTDTIVDGNYGESGVASNRLGWILRTPSGGRASFTVTIGNTGYPATSAYGEIDLYTWYQLTGVRNGSDLDLYLNGKHLVDSSATTGSIDYVGGYDDNTVHIGTWSRLGASEINHFPGIIDDVKIYNYARTPAQIAYDYNRGKPIGHWKLDECQGVTAYDSATGPGGSGGNNGTITAGDTSGSNDSVGTCSSGAGDEMWDNGTTGKLNASLDLDGTNDYISTVDDPLDIAGDITVSIWIKTTDKSETKLPISKYSSGEDAGWLIAWGTDGKPSFDGRTGAATYYTSGDASIDITDDQWHHLVGIRSGSEFRIYVDGKLGNSATGGSGSFANTEVMDIGRNTSGDANYFNGQIDDIRIYNYSLSETQIRKIMNESAVRFGPETGSP